MLEDRAPLQTEPNAFQCAEKAKNDIQTIHNATNLDSSVMCCLAQKKQNKFPHVILKFYIIGCRTPANLLWL